MPLYRDNAENLRDKAKYTETVWEHNSVQHALHALNESFKVVYLYNVCYIKHILIGNAENMPNVYDTLIFTTQ